MARSKRTLIIGLGGAGVKSIENYKVDYERWENYQPHTSHWDANLCRRMAEEQFELMPKEFRREGDL